MHGFLTRDGMTPQDFANAAHEELTHYPSVAFHKAEVVAACLHEDGFEVTFGDGKTRRCKKLLLATGLFDTLPEITGVDVFFGISVFQCPYCDGWEFRGQPLAAYGEGQSGLEMARALTTWSDDIVLCTNGLDGLTDADRRDLTANGIQVDQRVIHGLHGESGHLREIEFEGGARLARNALFFDTPTFTQSPLASELGCGFNGEGGIDCDRFGTTRVPGLYAAGNIVKDVQLTIVAAAEGTKAAFGINKALTQDTFAARCDSAKNLQAAPRGQLRVEVAAPH